MEVVDRERRPAVWEQFTDSFTRGQKLKTGMGLMRAWDWLNSEEARLSVAGFEVEVRAVGHGRALYIRYRGPQLESLKNYGWREVIYE